MALPQYGGEGKSDYKGTKSNMGLPQHGGEGNKLGKKGGDHKFTPGVSLDPKYCGPGRYLKVTSG